MSQTPTYPYIAQDREEPLLRGYGPAECSTETALAIVRPLIWDVNGYYRELGVSPYASIREIRQAWYGLDGHNNARLTYVFKQLNNKTTRAEYDAMPYGTPYPDQYVLDEIRKQVAEKARQRMIAEFLDPTDMDVQKRYEAEIYKEAGIEFEWDDALGDMPQEVLDSLTSGEQDQPGPAKFLYAYYLWRTSLFDETTQLQMLGEWQALLVSAFAKRGARLKFSVGLHGRTVHPAVRARVGDREVFFLHHLELPAASLAERLVNEWSKDQTPSHKEIQAS